MKELLIDYPIVIELPVAWGDMDAFQHVNNTVYFNHFESVRIVYFETIEFMKVMDKTGVGPILASTQCNYKIPLTYPDRISVGVKTETVEDYCFLMKYTTVSHKHKKIAASGEGMIVTFNYNENKKAPVPDEIRNRILDLEKSVQVR